MARRDDDEPGRPGAGKRVTMGAFLLAFVTLVMRMCGNIEISRDPR